MIRRLCSASPHSPPSAGLAAPPLSPSSLFSYSFLYFFSPCLTPSSSSYSQLSAAASAAPLVTPPAPTVVVASPPSPRPSIVSHPPPPLPPPTSSSSPPPLPPVPQPLATVVPIISVVTAPPDTPMDASIQVLGGPRAARWKCCSLSAVSASAELNG